VPQPRSEQQSETTGRAETGIIGRIRPKAASATTIAASSTAVTPASCTTGRAETGIIGRMSPKISVTASTIAAASVSAAPFAAAIATIGFASTTLAGASATAASFAAGL